MHRMADDAGDVPVLDQMWDSIERIGPRVQLALIQAVGHQQMESGVADAFYVDPERAQKCVDELLVAARTMRKALVNWRQTRFPPPGQDGVSVNMAHNAWLMSNRAEAYIMAWADQIETTARTLEKQLAAYRAVDEANSARHL